MRGLEGKVVLVIGGSRGLGYAIARELALSGARLALTSRRLDTLERARARLLERGCAAPGGRMGVPLRRERGAHSARDGRPPPTRISAGSTSWSTVPASLWLVR